MTFLLNDYQYIFIYKAGSVKKILWKRKDYELLYFKICHVMMEVQFEDINFLFIRVSFVVMKMKLTLHLYIALCVQLTYAQSVLKLLILQRH